MIREFKEFSTGAILKVGDTQLLGRHSISRQVENYTFIWNHDIPATIKVDSVLTTVEPNHIISLTPNQFLKIEHVSNVTVYQFNREFYCIKEHDKEVSCTGVLFFSNQLVPKVALDVVEQKKFFQLHSVLMEELDTEDTIQAEMLRMLMSRFIIKVTRLVKAQYPEEISGTPKMDMLREFNMFVEKHYKTEHQVAAYADMMFKSAKTLSNSFASYDKGPLQIIHDRIVLEAKRQLYYTNISSKEISFDLGFDDPSHFSRLFKKHTGESPSSFRKKLQKVA